MTYGIELTTRGTASDPLYSIMVSRHDKRPTLAARSLAKAYARKYGYTTVRELTGGFWLVDKTEGGLTVAQVSIRTL